ncbi:MAG: polyprenyl synthetase family protein [bacterium]|nr:polyprenyl synthetase family protein [bacterium]
MSAYHMGWTDADGAPAQAGGKHVRSNLCLWTASAFGGHAEDALPAACALELTHNFTLVHDDVQDRDQTRRGRPTVWSVWGEAQAINAGDGLAALAFRTLLGGAAGEGAGPPLERRARAAQVLTDALLEVIDGQCQDLGLEGRPDTPPEAYLRMIEAKTGALLGASLEMGAVMADAPPEAARRAGRAGRLLGIAFQLRDDWLGVWGEPEETGKSRENDLTRRKLTYPVVAAYAAATPGRRDELQRLYETQGPAEEPQIRRLLHELGGPDLTAGSASEYAVRARSEMERGGLDPAQVQEFADVATYVAERSR